MPDKTPKRHEENRKAAACTPIMPTPVRGFPKFGYIPLSGVINCRDLGGMPAADGKRIKKRRLLRSAALHDATAEDVKQLVRMHDLEYIIDLRAEYELEKEPDPLPLLQGVEYVNLPALSDGAIGFTGLKHFGGDMRFMMQYVKDPYQSVQDLYPKCLLGEFGLRAYSKFLADLLEESSGATLWHCTQGKDRTGVAAVLVEWSLGVPLDVIRNDYLATNLYIEPWVNRAKSLLSIKLLHKLGADVEAYAYASPCYFDTIFRTVNESFGSLDNYLEKALDFGPDKQAKLRELYLE